MLQKLCRLFRAWLKAEQVILVGQVEALVAEAPAMEALVVATVLALAVVVLVVAAVLALAVVVLVQVEVLLFCLAVAVLVVLEEALMATSKQAVCQIHVDTLVLSAHG